MLVRRAVQTDYAAFAAIEAACPGFPAWGEKGFEAEEANRNSVTLAAELDGAVAGFINFWILKPQVQLNTVAVKPELRRRGVAAALLGKLEEYARKSRCNTIDLEVNENNAGAIAFYAGQDFAEAGRRPKFYNDREAALLLRKTL